MCRALGLLNISGSIAERIASLVATTSGSVLASISFGNEDGFFSFSHLKSCSFPFVDVRGRTRPGSKLNSGLPVNTRNIRAPTCTRPSFRLDNQAAKMSRSSKPPELLPTDHRSPAWPVPTQLAVSNRSSHYRESSIPGTLAS